MSYPILYVPAVNCQVSPDNVRKHSDPTADAGLEANLGESRIVLQNLIGVPVKRRKNHYNIYAGSRRLTRVLSLIEKDQLPGDFQVPVMVVPTAEDAIEMSLAENFFALAMNPADACTAFRSIIEKENKTPADVAKRFGLTEKFVLGRLRLAGLAEPIFEALAKGEITLDIAKAYASTSDTVRQASVFEQLAGTYYRNNEAEIKRQLAAHSYCGSDPKALLVGRDTYVAAGGNIDKDLFSDADTERWTDIDLLDQLAEEALEKAAETIKEREGFAEVRTVAATHLPYMATTGLRRIHGVVPPLSEEQQARTEAITTEINAIEEAAADQDEYSEEQYERIQALETELAGIEDREPVYEPEQKAKALAYVVIGEDGQPTVGEALFVAETEENENDDDDETVTDEDNGDDVSATAGPGKPAMSQKLIDRLAVMRTELVALHVANDPHFAMDLGTFMMIDAAQRRFGAHDLASDLRAPKPDSRVGKFESETPAAVAWAKLEGELDRTWLDAGDVTQRFDAFRTLDDEMRASWFAWAIARTLQPVNDRDSGAPFLRHIGRALDIDVARWWRPTARNFFDAVTRPWILDLFETIGDAELKSRYTASKKHDLAASAEKLFAGQVTVEPEIKDKALSWVPDPMRLDEPQAEQVLPVAANDQDTGEPHSDEGDEGLAEAA